MARIFIEGFESGGLELWTNSGHSAPSATSPLSGTYSLSCTSTGTTYLQRDLGSNYSALYFKVRLQVTTNNAGQIPFQVIDSGGTVILTVQKTAGGYLEVRRGGYTGTVLSTGIIQILSTNTYSIEMYHAPLNSGGTVTVKIDGVQDSTYSGDTTLGLENIRTIRCCGGSGGSYEGYGKWDDIVIDDASWVGDTRIKGVIISGAGTTTQWDPSAGANYECVNEVPYSDSDYIYTNTTDEIDTYACTDVTVTGTVKCLQVHARGRKTGAPTPTMLQLAVRSGGSNYFSSSKDLPTTFGGQPAVLNIWATNPADSGAWEDADIDAVEIGVKAVSA